MGGKRYVFSEYSYFHRNHEALDKKYNSSFIIFLILGGKTPKEVKGVCVICETPICMFSTGLKKREFMYMCIIFFGVGHWEKTGIF